MNIYEIAAFIEQQTAAEVVVMRPQFGHIDVEGKLGKAALKPLMKKGHYVTAVFPEPDGESEGVSRIWFNEVDNAS